MNTQPHHPAGAQERRVLPLPGPLHVDPAGEVANLQTARLQLGAAVSGLQLGVQDRQVIAWLTGTDVSRVATVASLLRRAFEAGVQAERDEARQDVEGLEADLRVARADCARVVDEREHLRADVAGLMTAAEVLQHEADEAAAERNREEIRADQFRAEVAAADRDRNALTRILATAADVSVRFDAEKVSAQGAFERLLSAITDAGGAR